MKKELDRIDNLLLGLIDLAEIQMENSISKNFFSKDLAEAVGVVISLAYGRFSNDKQTN